MNNDAETKTWKSRLKVAVAGLALAGALAGGASVATDQAVPAEDTTEAAWGWGGATSGNGGFGPSAGWGVSWR